MTTSERANSTQVSVDTFKTGAWVMDLDAIAAWMQGMEHNRADLNNGFARGFLSLKRRLLEQADNDAVRERGMELMRDFVARVRRMLEAEALPPEDLPLLFGILMTVVGEVGPYRYETRRDPEGTVASKFLRPMEEIRAEAIAAAKLLFRQPVFGPVAESIAREIDPLLEVAAEAYGEERDQYMPFRIIQAGKVAERLLDLAHWLEARPQAVAGKLVDVLYRCYDLKYPRFGTSGLRGVWQKDFTEIKARRTAQAICQFLTASDIPDFVVPRARDFSGKWIVMGYDGRRNSTTVVNWIAETVLANGFSVYITSRPTPTPVIAFFTTEVVGEDAAGIINCTASHNPPDWQGIKFNPREGYAATTHLTDIIAARLNEMQLLDVQIEGSPVAEAEEQGRVRYYDPIQQYHAWLHQNGKGNARIPLHWDKMREYFRDRLVVVDEMHGAGRGYMEIILGRQGIPFQVLHHERDENLGGLPYANPEMPFIQPLIDTVKETRAALGMGMDTDADRFGLVDEGGMYYRPNQILAMLSYYLGCELKLSGRIVITQTGLPMINAIAEHFPNIERPAEGSLPPYIDATFYKRRVGEREDVVFKNTFVVPVGIKYIVEIPRMTTNYKLEPDEVLPSNWMDRLLIGGEESSGLTTRGHVADKDGIWANLLIMDMVAYYKKPLSEIWKMVCSAQGGWISYGGRVDVDASDRAKEKLISYYLDAFKGKKPGEVMIEGYPVLYAGGIRYDMVEIFLGDKEGRKRNFLRIRASGTEPINRIYTETSDPELWRKLLNFVMAKLDEFSVEEIQGAYRIERLADLLANTSPGDWEKVARAVKDKLAKAGWKRDDLITTLHIKSQTIERHNQHIVHKWLEIL